MSNEKSLYVPIRLDAWIVNDIVLSAPQPDNIPRNIQRWSNPYSTEFELPTISLESTTPKGIYLHWTLPAALKQGTSVKNDNELKDCFPLVPNRWLVIRSCASNPTFTPWIIESDYCNDDGTTPFLSDKGITKIGKCWKLSDYNNTSNSSPIKLTAVSSGDINFSMFQPHANNVFSFYDKWSSPPSDDSLPNQDTISYFVAGWYANPTQNPFNASNPAELLNNYQWTTSSSVNGAQPEIQQIFCHGMVSSISWNINDDHVPDSPWATKLNNLNLSVGNSSFDALSALVSAALLKNSSFDNATQCIARAITAIGGSATLAQLDDIDIDQQASQDSHQSWFGAQSGGITSQVVKNTKAGDAPITDYTLSTDLILQLNNLNQQQAKLDKAQRDLQGLQWNLYAMWWKYGAASQESDPRGSGRWPLGLGQDPNSSFNTKLSSLQSLVVNQLTQISALQTNIGEFRADLLTKLGNLQLKDVPRSRFWFPNDPVVLVSGLSSPWITSDQEPNPLPCRYDEQLKIEINSSNPNLQVTNKMILNEISKKNSTFLSNLNNISQVSIQLTNLITEFYLFDPNNYASLAQSASGDPNTLSKIIQSYLNDPSNYLTSYAMRLNWSQPWFPLLLSWSANWYAFPFNQWKYSSDDKDYTCPNLPSKVQGVRLDLGLACATLLTPQSNFLFKAKLKQFFSNNPQAITLLAKNNITISTLMDNIDKWDILTLRLEGLTDFLITRNSNGQKKIPLATSNINNENASDPSFLTADQWESTVATQIGNECQSVPIPKVNDSAFAFLPTRGGQFSLNSLIVIDKYGQALNCDYTQSVGINIPIYVSDSLTPTSEAAEGVNCIQLPLRINQSARLNFDFIDANNKNILFNYGANPIVGWLLPNYLDQAFLIYDQDGTSLGEITLSITSPTQILWQQTPYCVCNKIEDIKNLNLHLSALLDNLINTNQPADAFYSLLETIDYAYTTTPSLTVSSPNYLSALQGRPIALVRTQLQLELAQSPYQDQSWAATFNPPAAEILNYSFTIQLGNADFSKDGLLGYYLVSDAEDGGYSTFHSVYPVEASLANPYFIDNSSLDSSPSPIQLNPQIAPEVNCTYVTLMMDPANYVHAYSGILPAQVLQLDPRYYQSALSNMTMSFKIQPLLTIRSTVPSIDGPGHVNEAVCLPMPVKSKNWAWVETRYNEKTQQRTWYPDNANPAIVLQATDNKARVMDNSIELVDGYLFYQPAVTKQPAAVTSLARPLQSKPKNISSSSVQTVRKFYNNSQEKSQGSSLTAVVSPDPYQNISTQNSAVTLFLNEKALDFHNWYHPEICHYLLQMAENNAKCLRVMFHDANEGNNTNTFKNQLLQLVMLSHWLKRPALFISKEPGADNHFICGLVKEGNLLLINPLGMTEQDISYQTLAELKQEKTIKEIWISSNPLQKRQYEAEGLVSCGPITVELATHILIHFTPQELDIFWENNLKTDGHTVHDASGLTYYGINIETLLPETLKALIKATGQSRYESQVCDIRQKHRRNLQALPIERANNLNTTVEDYLSNCKEGGPHQLVFNALITEKTLNNIDELPAYQLLKQELNWQATKSILPRREEAKPNKVLSQQNTSMAENGQKCEKIDPQIPLKSLINEHSFGLYTVQKNALVFMENQSNWGRLANRAISKYAFCFFDTSTLRSVSCTSKNSYIVCTDLEKEYGENEGRLVVK